MAGYERNSTARSPGLKTPRSVMMPVMNSEGVTSKAGFKTLTPDSQAWQFVLLRSERCTLTSTADPL